MVVGKSMGRAEVEAGGAGEEKLRKEVQRRMDDFVNKQDSFGNTALHLAVFHNQTDSFDWLMAHGGEKSLMQLNAQGLSPFTLAASEGKAPMFLHILKTHLSMMLWKYGPVSCYYRNLAQLDTFCIQPKQERAKSKFARSASRVLFGNTAADLSGKGNSKRHLEIRTASSAKGKEDPADDFLKQWSNGAGGAGEGEEEEALEEAAPPPDNESLQATARMHGDPSWRSALEIIIQQRVEVIMQNQEVAVLVKKIVKKKWQQFGKRMHLTRRVIPYMVLVALYTTMMVLRSTVLHQRKVADFNDEPWEPISAPFPVATLVFEILVLAFLPILAVFAYDNLHLNINDLDIDMDGKTSTHERVLFIYKNVPAILDIFIIVGLVVVVCLRAAGAEHYEINGLAMTGVLVWCNVLSVLAPYQFFGALVITIHKMLVGDVAKFLVIYIVLVTGFGIGIFLLLQNGAFPLDEIEQQRVKCVNCDTYLGTMILKLVWVSVGEADQTELLNLTSSPNLAYGMHLVYVILSLVLLLNLIIAMMGDTYQRQFEDVEKEWFFPHASLVLKYEKWLTDEQRNMYRLGFSTSFAGASEPKKDKHAGAGSGRRASLVGAVRRFSTASNEPQPEVEMKAEELELDGQNFHWFQDLLTDGHIVSEEDEVIRL